MMYCEGISLKFYLKEMINSNMYKLRFMNIRIYEECKELDIKSNFLFLLSFGIIRILYNITSYLFTL